MTVDVTFLRMDTPPADPPPPLPSGLRIEHAAQCSVPFYRYLYDTVGEPWLWWMRRTASDADLAALLSMPAISVHVLVKDGEPAGFYELDRRAPQVVNLAYFGLMPWSIGTGIGRAFLRHAIDAAWASGRGRGHGEHLHGGPSARPARLCRRRLPALRTVREVWPVPRRLGLKVPAHLARAG